MTVTRRSMALACAALLAGFAAQAQAQGVVTGAQALRQIYDKRDTAHKVEVTTAPKVRIGKDNLDFMVKSSKAGFVYVLMAGADNKSMTLLFPNRLDSNNNRIAEGQVLKLPRPAWAIKFDGPPGVNTMLVMVADSPRNLTALKLEGEFLTAQNNAEGRELLTTNITRSGAVNNPRCKEEGIKDSLLCSNAFGAAVVTVEEVR